MTHEEEFEAFVGGLDDEEEDCGLCMRCNDYPCCCTTDEIMLHDDWQAEIYARIDRERK